MAQQNDGENSMPAVPDNPLGEKRPRKATRRERDQRVDIVITLLVSGFSKRKIAKHLREKFHLANRTIDKYIRLARDELLKETDRSRDEMRAEMWAGFQAILLNGEATIKERIEARKAMIDLYGLNAPKKFVEQRASDDLDEIVENLTFEQMQVLSDIQSMKEKRLADEAHEMRIRREGKIIDIDKTEESEDVDSLQRSVIGKPPSIH